MFLVAWILWRLHTFVVNEPINKRLILLIGRPCSSTGIHPLQESTRIGILMYQTWLLIIQAASLVYLLLIYLGKICHTHFAVVVLKHLVEDWW